MSTRPLRRLVAVSVCLAVALLPQPASSDTPGRWARAGDRASGPPDWRVLAPLSTNGVRWSDVAKDHWAKTAIDYVAATNTWMRDRKAGPDGRYEFRPESFESRKLFARTLVRAYGAGFTPDPALEFADLPATHRFYRFANVAVSQGWMEAEDGRFLPRRPVTTRAVHLALVLASGLGEVAAAAETITLRDGTTVAAPPGFGTLLLGMRMGLRYNHGEESLDVGPDSSLSRAEVAWSLYRAATMPSWVGSSLAAYSSIELPSLSEKMRQVLGWGLRYVGYPYIWAGEWHEGSPEGYCCGYQPQGGFDCSGLAWWVMKKAEGGWSNVPPREYEGWGLPQRSSAQMASVGGKLAWADTRAGDLLFYDGNGDGIVDHVNVYLGNGWALDSGSSSAGVTLTRVAGNWYEDHFVHARSITKK
jgi:hypothetical protein